MTPEKLSVVVKWSTIGLGFIAGLVVGSTIVDRLEKKRQRIVWRG